MTAEKNGAHSTDRFRFWNHLPQVLTVKVRKSKTHLCRILGMYACHIYLNCESKLSPVRHLTIVCQNYTTISATFWNHSYCGCQHVLEFSWCRTFSPAEFCYLVQLWPTFPPLAVLIKQMHVQQKCYRPSVDNGVLFVGCQ